MGMATTAEGVETPEQLAKVRAQGCTQAQGYLFSPARSADQVHKLIEIIEAKSEAAA
jgi:EAL domain-containing protein (putative c-di-GMP-specific phosphodiesterase class I)